jgi:hypothetical protein
LQRPWKAVKWRWGGTRATPPQSKVLEMLTHVKLSILEDLPQPNAVPPWEPLTPAEQRKVGNDLWVAFDFVHPTLLAHCPAVDLMRFRQALNSAVAALRGVSD